MHLYCLSQWLMSFHINSKRSALLLRESAYLYSLKMYAEVNYWILNGNLCRGLNFTKTFLCTSQANFANYFIFFLWEFNKPITINLWMQCILLAKTVYFWSWCHFELIITVTAVIFIRSSKGKSNVLNGRRAQISGVSHIQTVKTTNSRVTFLGSCSQLDPLWDWGPAGWDEFHSCYKCWPFSCKPFDTH